MGGSDWEHNAGRNRIKRWEIQAAKMRQEGRDRRFRLGKEYGNEQEERFRL